MVKNSLYKYEKSLCWLRRDLRLSDHRPLHEAFSQSQTVAAVFVLDTNILKKLAPDDRRIIFILDCLGEIKSKLKAHGSDLIVLKGDPRVEIPRLAKSLNVNAVFCGNDYEPDALQRDDQVSCQLEKQGIQFVSIKDHVVFEKHEILTKEHKPFKVFTPYKNQWHRQFHDGCVADYQIDIKRFIKTKSIQVSYIKNLNLKSLGFKNQKILLQGGEAQAQKRLKLFLNRIDQYDSMRDFPKVKGTSGLSSDLRFGCVSIRRLVREALYRKSNGAKVWINELIWRDFYQMILFHFPQVIKGCFNKKYNAIRWPGGLREFNAWKNGITGYPLIDAAMREFQQTGWMHNRLRMVVASFLVKDLMVDWRVGEKYFAENLIDFDLAANNGGWQWCASTGTDAQPYFRIFNPVSQSQKYDPDGEYIKRFCPELKKLPPKYVHQPSVLDDYKLAEYGIKLGRDYPYPIVNHAEQRLHVLNLYKSCA